MTDQTTPPQDRRGARHDLTRRPRLRGEDRDRVRTQLAEDYTGDASIRALAAKHDLSYGLTRTLLVEANVELRPGRRRPKAAGQ